MTDTLEQLEAAGLKTAAKNLKETAERARKLNLAYQQFEWIRQEAIEKFNEQLRADTFQEMKEQSPFSIRPYQEWKQLKFVPLEDYETVPPAEVVSKIIEAKKLNIFDRFEVARIETVKVLPDPIVFGVINGCTDRFFVAQWDEDVKIEQLLEVQQKLSSGKEV